VVQKDPKPATATIQVLTGSGALVLGMDLPVKAEERVKIDQVLPLENLVRGVYRLRVAASGDAGFTEKDLGFIVR
jgi:hypothetical protein